MSNTRIEVPGALEQYSKRLTDTKGPKPYTSTIIDPRGSPMSWRSKRFTKSVRAGLKMPVGRIHKYLKKGNFARRIGLEAAVYLAAVLEYLVAELLDEAAQAAKESSKIRISPRHLLMAIRYDQELNSLLGKPTIREEGTVPTQPPPTLPKKTSVAQNQRLVRP